ncbi:MAG: hypothetical protein WCD28_13815, partial [Nitrososphaeraceae archaeon]
SIGIIRAYERSEQTVHFKDIPTIEQEEDDKNNILNRIMPTSSKKPRGIKKKREKQNIYSSTR